MSTFIPQWIVAYFIIPPAILLTYSIIFYYIIKILTKVCKDNCLKGV
jgi:hypothetical protein